MEAFKQLLNDYSVSSLYIDNEIITDLFVLAINDNDIRVIDKNTELIYNIDIDIVCKAYIKGQCTLFEEEVLYID